MGKAERIQRRSVSQDLVSVTDNLRLSLQAELAALENPAGTPAMIAGLEAAKLEADDLRKRSARWQITLNDGIGDLIADMEYDLRDRLRRIQRDAENAIDQGDPGPTWTAFTKWLEECTAAAISDTFVWTSERSQWLATQVAEHFSEDEVTLPVLRVSDTGDALDPVDDMPGLDDGHINPMQKVLIGMRGSYGGVLMFGLLTGIFGMALINPLSVGAGLLLGAQGLPGGQGARLKRRQSEAKALVRRQLDDVVFQVGKQLKDRLRMVQRSTRDHFTEIAEEHHRSLSDSVSAAQKAATTYKLKGHAHPGHQGRAQAGGHLAAGCQGPGGEGAGACQAGTRGCFRTAAGSGGGGSRMKVTTVAGVADLIQEALAAYRDDPAAVEALEGWAARLSEPLRIAVAGMVKAGKSTLLNAIIGEEIAPTDTGECTRIVTWYRFAHSPRIMLHPVAGEPRPLPLRRSNGRLVFDLGRDRAEDVERLVVEWPSESLRNVTLIDTPGIASLSERRFGPVRQFPHSCRLALRGGRHCVPDAAYACRRSAVPGVLQGHRGRPFGNSQRLGGFVPGRRNRRGADRFPALGRGNRRAVPPGPRPAQAGIGGGPGGRSAGPECPEHAPVRLRVAGAPLHLGPGGTGAACCSPRTGFCGRAFRTALLPRRGSSCWSGSACSESGWPLS